MIRGSFRGAIQEKVDACANTEKGGLQASHRHPCWPQVSQHASSLSVREGSGKHLEVKLSVFSVSVAILLAVV